MPNLLFGIFALGFGLYTLYLRLFKQSEGLGKLEPMKKSLGEKPGLIIHIICYTVVPIAFGIFSLVNYFLIDSEM